MADCILNLIRAEWLKLTRRPLTWALLGIFLGLLVVQFFAQFVLVNLAGALRQGGGGVGLTAQLEEWRRRTTFPGLFGAVFNHINGLGGIFAIVLAAGAMGSEYSWGTIRTQLARQPSRGRYLIAKTIALLALLSVGVALALLVGSLTGGALGALVGIGAWPDFQTILLLPLATIRALYVLLPYVLLTLCLTIAGRSLLVGVAGGLLYLVFEAAFGTLAVLRMLGGAWLALYNLTIQQNINTLTLLNSRTFGLRPEALAPLDLTQLPSPLQATLVVGFYSATFLASALYLFFRRDVTGAT